MLGFRDPARRGGALEELDLGPFEFHFGSTVLAGGGSEVALPGVDDFDIGGTGGFQGAALTPGHYWLSVYATTGV